MYVMVCMLRLNDTFRTSFSSKARMMGVGKPKIKLVKLIPIVLRTTLKKSGDLKKSLKCWNPTQSVPAKPVNILYSLNAINIPYIGLYENKYSRMIAGKRNIYSILCSQILLYSSFLFFFSWPLMNVYVVAFIVIPLCSLKIISFFNLLYIISNLCFVNKYTY